MTRHEMGRLDGMCGGRAHRHAMIKDRDYDAGYRLGLRTRHLRMVFDVCLMAFAFAFCAWVAWAL